VAIFAVVIVASLVVAKSCGKTDPEVSKERASAIARAQVDYEPECTVIRYQKQGFSQDAWLVGLAPVAGERTVVTNVQIDAGTGNVLSITQARGTVQC